MPDTTPFVYHYTDMSFSTKAELLQKAFELYGDQYPVDIILDRCTKIWNKVQAMDTTVEEFYKQRNIK